MQIYIPNHDELLINMQRALHLTTWQQVLQQRIGGTCCSALQVLACAALRVHGHTVWQTDAHLLPLAGAASC